MDYLEKVLSNYKSNQEIVNIRIYDSFYFELKKETPDVVIWKDNFGVINISSNIEYKNEIKMNILKMQSIPKALYAIDDKETLQNLYDVFGSTSEYEELINGIINVIKNKILKLDWS